MPAPLSGARALSERAQACHAIWAPRSMLGRQASRATCRQSHCLSAMQPGKALGTCLASRSPATRCRSCSMTLKAQMSSARPRASGARAALLSASCRPVTATASGTCSFLTAWRATRSRRLSRRHPQRLASRVLRIQRAPTARRRSTRALAVRLSAVGVAVTFGRGRTPCPSPPEGQPHQPLVDSTSLRTLLDCVVVG